MWSRIKHQRFRSKSWPTQNANYFLAFLIPFPPLFPSILLQPSSRCFKSKRHQSTLSFCNTIAERGFSRYNLEFCKQFCCRPWSCLHRAQEGQGGGTGLFTCCVAGTQGQQLFAGGGGKKYHHQEVLSWIPSLGYVSCSRNTGCSFSILPCMPDPLFGGGRADILEIAFIHRSL